MPSPSSRHSATFSDLADDESPRAAWQNTSANRRISYSRGSIYAACALLLIIIWIRVTSRDSMSGDCMGFGKILKPTNYTVVQGIFKQSDPEFKSEGYDVLADSFGLIDQSPDRWTKFEQHINGLNQEADDQTTYKVIYLARHGQGVHNVAEEKYGTPAWNCKWSLLETDGELVWGPDPLLTAHGKDQIRHTRDAWKREIKAGIPLPQVLYSSPLRRAIDTAELTWNELPLPPNVPRKIKENLREMIGLHTCDKRSTRTSLEQQYPEYQFDANFTDADELWTPDHQEQAPQIAIRARSFLNELFAADPNTFISITGHGGIIGGLLTAIGHRKVSVQTGGLIPIVIRASSDPSKGMEPIEAGSSGTAPVCSSSSVNPEDVIKETRGVAQEADLLVQSP